MAAGQRHLAARPRELELELLGGRVGEHDEAALRAGHFDRRVEHEREHFVEHAARPERAEPFEEPRHVRQQFRGGRDGAPVSVSSGRQLLTIDEKGDLVVVGLPEADAIAVDEQDLRDALAPDKRTELRPAVLDPGGALLGDDLGVHARNAATGDANIGLRAAADRQERLVDGDDPPADLVPDEETRSDVLGHGHTVAEKLWTASGSRS